jgi:tyrosyl-tRNA synthetase
MNVLDTLKERGFLAQITFEEDLYKRLDSEPIVFYAGFDPTADSLHIGHCVPVMAMAHLQHAGHFPIALCGGGTAMIGDPSGKTELRKMLTQTVIQDNITSIAKQLGRFLDLSPGHGMTADNGDWLLKLNYVDFIRDIGALFSVNRMLTAECYKQRMEKGLTFLEFNYMIMQSYDFLRLFCDHGCRLQIGGDDQWSNILAGADLIRRKERQDAFALTCKLISTHDGKKMGKTEAGALWLDPARTSPYDFYQYWRNVADADTEHFLALMTFLPMDEVRRLGSLRDNAANEAKRVLAYEITRLVHGEEEAQKAQDAAQALFGGGADSANIPSYDLLYTSFREDSRLTTILALCGLCQSRSEARQMVQAGAVSANEQKAVDMNQCLEESAFDGKGLLLRKGKKNYCRLILRK